MEKKKIYAGFFLQNGKHVTWEFGPGSCTLPWDVDDKEGVVVKVVGKYHDDDIDADIVEVYVPSTGVTYTEQATGQVPLHITRRADGVPPVESGRRALEYGWTPLPESECYTIKGKAGYYYA